MRFQCTEQKERTYYLSEAIDPWLTWIYRWGCQTHQGKTPISDLKICNCKNPSNSECPKRPKEYGYPRFWVNCENYQCKYSTVQQSAHAYFAIVATPGELQNCEHLTLTKLQLYLEISNDPRQVTYKKVRITVAKFLGGGFKAQNSVLIDLSSAFTTTAHCQTLGRRSCLLYIRQRFCLKSLFSSNLYDNLRAVLFLHTDFFTSCHSR